MMYYLDQKIKPYGIIVRLTDNAVVFDTGKKITYAKLDEELSK